MSFPVMGTRPVKEGFASFYSALMLCILSIGGTMIMRKFHNSMAVGFFLGGVLSMSQMFFLLFLIYIGYAKEQKQKQQSAKEESLMAICALIQSVLLGSFAAILAAHRSEILDQNPNDRDSVTGSGGGGGGSHSKSNRRAEVVADESGGYRQPLAQPQQQRISQSKYSQPQQLHEANSQDNSVRSSEWMNERVSEWVSESMGEKLRNEIQ